jgi:hypothetical protein
LHHNRCEFVSLKALKRKLRLKYLILLKALHLPTLVAGEFITECKYFYLQTPLQAILHEAFVRSKKSQHFAKMSSFIYKMHQLVWENEGYFSIDLSGVNQNYVIAGQK